MFEEANKNVWKWIWTSRDSMVAKGGRVSRLLGEALTPSSFICAFCTTWLNILTTGEWRRTRSGVRAKAKYHLLKRFETCNFVEHRRRDGVFRASWRNTYLPLSLSSSRNKRNGIFLVVYREKLWRIFVTGNLFWSLSEGSIRVYVAKRKCYSARLFARMRTSVLIFWVISAAKGNRVKCYLSRKKHVLEI